MIDPTLEDEIMITVIASGFDRADQPASFRPATSNLSRNNPPISTVREPVHSSQAAVASNYSNRQDDAAASARRQPEMPQFLFGDPEQPKPAAAPTRTFVPLEEQVQDGYFAAGQPGAPSAPYSQPSGFPQQGFANQPAYPQQPSYAPQQAPYAPAPSGYPQQGGGRPQPNAAPSRSGRAPATAAAPETKQPEKKNRILPWFLTDNDNLDE